VRIKRPQIRKQLLEGLTLILAATSILAAGVAAVLVLEEHLGLERAWVLFVAAVCGYTLITFYLLNQVRPLWKRAAKLPAATIVIELPVLGLWFLFYSGVLALPDSMSPYTIGGVLVAPAMVILVESFVLSRGVRPGAGGKKTE